MKISQAQHPALQHGERHTKIANMNRFYLILFFACFAVVSFAQLERDSINIILDLQDIQNVQFVDIDNDGDDDVFGSRYGYNGQFILLRNSDGQGTLGAAEIFGDTSWEALPSVYNNFELGDMDNDGDIDIVAGKMARSSTPFWENDGTGQFTEPAVTVTTYTIVRESWYHHVADMNADGWQDIVVYNPGSGALWINWNQGAGEEFVLELIEDFDDPGSAYANDFQIIDHDLDGTPELFFLASVTLAPQEKQLELFVYKQCNTNCFEETFHTQVSVMAKNFSKIISGFADLNNDSWPELIIGYSQEDLFPAPLDEQSSNFIKIFENQIGNDTFTLAADWEDYHHFAIGDINADGQNDLFAVWDENSNGYSSNGSPGNEFAYHWFENEGDFSFAVNEIDNIYAGRDLYSRDWDQDGQVDLIVDDDGNLVLRKQSINNTFNAPEGMNELLPTIVGLSPIDWDLDGDMDILTVSDHHFNECCPDEIYVLLNEDGQGNYGPPISLATLNGGISAVQFEDFNQDGFLDVVGSLRRIEGTSQANRPFVFLSDPANNSGEIFIDPTLYVTSNYYIKAIDMDNDGDADIIFPGIDHFDVLWNELNEGNGFVAQAEFMPVPIYSSETFFDVADINHDNLSDLLYGTSDSIFYTLHLDGNGTFDEWQAILAGPNGYFSDVLIADFDTDGDEDLRYQIRGSNNINPWVLSRFDSESGTYTTPTQVQAGGYISSGWDHAFEFDGQPGTDVFTRFGFQSNIPLSGYHTQPYMPTPYDQWLPGKCFVNAKLADVNGDGKNELITGYNEIIWYDLDFISSDIVEGLLLWDTTAMCQFDSLNPPLSLWNVVVESENTEQLAVTNSDGHYGAMLPDTGLHVIHPVPLSSYWTICEQDSISVSALGDTVSTAHFTAIANTDCPLLQVALNMPHVNQCIPSTMGVSYRNIGTLPAEDASITIAFDDRLTPLSSTMPWASMTDTSLVFEFPTIVVGETSFFQITFEPDCADLELDELVCFSARIFPDSLCENMLLPWDGAHLIGSTFCNGDSLAFVVQNIGDGNMEMPQALQVDIVNDDLVLFLNTDVILDAGEADTIMISSSFPARFTIAQTPGHPFPEDIQLLSNSCTSGGENSNIDAFTQFPMEEGDGFFAQICRRVIGPYDPNDKMAHPAGFGSQNFIEKDWEINYTIRFQNTGNAPAQTVILRDSLSDFLDISSLRPISASHDFHWQMLPGRELVVTYPDINLVDSTANAAASQGYFSFAVKVHPDAPFHAAIKNDAYIYFDFNDPILTNETLHTLKKPSVSSTQFFTICEDAEFTQDTTIIASLHEYEDYDSIVWTYFTVIPTLYNEQEVTLDEAGFWQGQYFDTTTTIIDVLTSAITGCDSIVTYEINVLTNDSEPLWKSAVSIGPNPADQALHVAWPAALSQNEITLKLFNVIGQEIYNKGIPVGIQSHRIDRAKWPAGKYFLELSHGTEKARWGVIFI